MRPSPIGKNGAKRAWRGRVTFGGAPRAPAPRAPTTTTKWRPKGGHVIPSLCSSPTCTAIVALAMGGASSTGPTVHSVGPKTKGLAWSSSMAKVTVCPSMGDGATPRSTALGLSVVRVRCRPCFIHVEVIQTLDRGDARLA